MATTYKVLGQLNPAATTATDLYTVPSATQAVVSTIVIANLSTSATNFRIAIRVNGASLANNQYIAHEVIAQPSDSTALTLGITLNAGDVITVYSGNANLTFTAFGSEIS
jgi:glucose-6-phosphate dehydrogenase assembly protein OpcA